eukprot:12414127-Karenia_brevis.AAC.1
MMWLPILLSSLALMPTTGMTKMPGTTGLILASAATLLLLLPGVAGVAILELKGSTPGACRMLQ